MSSPIDLLSIERRVSALEARMSGLTPTDRALAIETPIAELVGDVAFLTGLQASDILSSRRAERFVRARDAVVWVALRTTGFSYPRLGRCLGDRDHTTILACRLRGERRRAKEPAFQNLTNKLLEQAAARAATAAEARP